MNEVSLFTGAGGGLLGTKLLGFKHIGYVEINEYCQKIIRQRIKDGILDAAPIFTDIRKFISEGYAEAYKGMVDVITAGFPCQPFSVAGKGLGEDDPRNMWPATIECIRIIRPRYALLENVPGLLTHKYIGRIFGDLAEIGYDAVWRPLSAWDVGALHKRERIWIIAHPSDYGCKHSFNGESGMSNQKRQVKEVSVEGEPFSDKGRFHKEVCSSSFIRTANGTPNRVDRLKAIGNGQVSAVVKTVWELLNG